jgi:hypothetical protein
LLNPDHTPTGAQSQNNSPAGTPKPENRPKRSNGNDGQKQNRMRVVFTIHSILFLAIVTVAPFRSVFWVWGISWSVVWALCTNWCAPTSAQSPDNRPTDAPNPENRQKRSNGNEGQRQNRMNGKDNQSQRLSLPFVLFCFWPSLPLLLFGLFSGFGASVGLLSGLCVLIRVWSGFDPSIGLPESTWQNKT